MSSRLDRIDNWAGLAKECNFRLKDLAKRCKVSERQLERYLLVRFGVRPKRWLDELRAEMALTLISEGEIMKVVADKLGFKQSSHFSRFFKQAFGTPPSEYHNRARMSGRDK
jgi:AraC family transcriptional regulator, arabinose operon regulatory protein